MFWPWLTSLCNPQTFNTAKFLVLNRFTEPSRDNFRFGGNLTNFILYLTDNLTMTNFLLYPLLFSQAELLTLDIFSKVSWGQIKKAINFTFWFNIRLNGLASFLHVVVFFYIKHHVKHRKYNHQVYIYI